MIERRRHGLDVAIDSVLVLAKTLLRRFIVR